MVDAVDWVERSGHGTCGRVNVLCSWAKQVTLTVPLTIQENKWVPAIFQGSLMKFWGGGGGYPCDRLAPIQEGGEGNDTLGRFYVKETGISSGMVCHLARELT